MTTYPLDWLQKVNKTIAMIHASPGYQAYVKQKRLRLLRESNRFEQGKVGRHFSNDLKEKQNIDCFGCGAYLLKRSASGMCRECLRKALVVSSRSGDSIKQMSKKFRICEEYVIMILKGKSKLFPIKENKNPLNEANEIVNEAFKHPNEKHGSLAFIAVNQ